jgi:RHS repeat-associated protein
MSRFPRLLQSRLPFALMFSVLDKICSSWSTSSPKPAPRLKFAHADPMKRVFQIFALAMLICVAGLALAQVSPGTPSFSAYDSHTVDTINLQNLNIMLNIPVMSKSGAFPFKYGINGNSYFYQVDHQWTPSLVSGTNGLNGAASGMLGIHPIGYTTVGILDCPDGINTTTKYTNWYIAFADGTVHWLPSTDYTDSKGCLNPSFTDQVIDGSGYTLSVTGTTVNSIYDRSGMSVYGALKDSNGNKITAGSSFTDTLGLAVLTLGPYESYIWTDVNGGSPKVAATSGSLSFKTVFGCSGATEVGLTNYAVLTGYTFPDSTSIGITFEGTPGYSGYYTGRLGQLTLRSGGTVNYTYSGGNNGINCTYQVPPTMKRQTSDGTTTYTWAAVNNGNGWGNTTTVLDQGGNKTVYTFTGLTSTGNAALPTVQALTEVQHYQGSSTLLTTDVYCYNAKSGQPGNCSTAVVSLPITEVDVYHTIVGMSSSRQQTQYDGGPSGTLPHYGNVTYSAQYDFGATTPTQTTTIVYGSSNGSGACSAIGNNINNKPCTVISTQNGATVGYSQFTYDIHGNLLKTYVSANGGTSFLSNATNNVYNSNGTPSITYDLANNPTTYGYNSNSYVSCGTCTQFPFPTSIAKGGLTTYSTWNGIGGVKLTDTDASGNVTPYGYQSSSGAADPWWRVSSITDPLINEVWKSYTATSLNSSFTFNSSINNTTVTTDGYGRRINTQTQQGPSASNYDTVSTAYGWSSNYKTVATSQPCSATVGGSCSTVHTNYIDPLGRLYQASTTSNETLTHTYTQNDDLAVLTPAPSGENIKQVQRQYDGLGRVTKSCAIGNGSTTACGQSTGSANGVTTSTSYTSGTGYQTVSSTRGSQTRSQTVDGLGRVTSSMTPEGGTATNVYDTLPSACNNRAFAHPGKLIYSGFANGNFSCYQYDSLGRVTAITGVSGTNYLCKRFFYDNSSGATGTIPSGITISNPYGRVVEAETDNCSLPITPITDEWSSYDKDGHVTDIWEKTPHSGVYYHSVATFAGNGVPLTVQLANPSLYTMTYGLEGEGRLSTVKSGTEIIVSGTTFNASAQPQYIDLGTGTDQSDYNYDPNTGRMTNWTFQAGSTSSETGTLTWNPNGTLNKVAIVDGFNSGGSQTCHFNPSDAPGTGYDDLGRLVGIDCGSGGWGQTFSYDEYDNLTKAVISGRIGVTWNPMYNPANNHYLSGANYDNSGNLTYDTIHLYTWDQFNKLSTIDSSACSSGGECITYDALGRIVETSYNGTYTEIWYTQLGKGVYMHGSSPFYAYWPGPGGSTVEANGNAASFYYMHKDWLGNSRISQTIISHTVVSDQAYAPFGEVYNELATGAGVPGQMFTGDTQDILTGIFDTPNRELNASQGRWLSPDPAGAGWNLYAYTTNPNSGVDPSGLVTINPSWYMAFAEGAGGVQSLSYTDLVTGIPSGTGTVAADNGSSTANGGASGGGTLNMNFSAGAAMLAGIAASLFQQTPEAGNEEDDEEGGETQWGQALVPLNPGEFVQTPISYQYNLLSPGPLDSEVAQTFAGGQYSMGVVGQEGLGFDTPVWRVSDNPDPTAQGSNGTFYAVAPQVGGLKSAIDLAINPNWGAAGTPGGNPNSNGLGLSNALCVYLQPGTTYAIGPIGSQGGAWVGGGIQIYVPPHP